MSESLPSNKSKQENPNVTRARELVLSYGWNSTSFQIVNPGINRWFSDADDAVVGYVTSKRVRVVAGAPVCDERRLNGVVEEFELDSNRAGERVCYFAAEERLESTLAKTNNHSKFLIGAQPVWNPLRWAEKVVGHKSLRAQISRSRNKGVTVEEWPIEKAANHPELFDCLGLWLASKGLPPLHFMVETNTLNRLANRRVFVALHRGTVAGFIVLSPIAKRHGWLFEQFPHRPGAPNGTVELMVDSAMRAIAEDRFEYATLGLSPLSKRSDIEPDNQPLWLCGILAWLRKHGQRFYNFDGLDSFKAKLRPDRWDPVFAVSNEPQVSFRTLNAIAGAFGGGSAGKLIISGLLKSAMTEIHWLRSRILPDAQ